MLHAYFQDHRTSSYGEDFLRILPYHGHGSYLGHVTFNFHSPFPRKLNIKFGFDWPNGFRGDV